MSDFQPVKMSLLKASKETDNKVRWDAFIGDTKFSLYIPKWRVPRPWPETIRVTIAKTSDGSEIKASRITPSQCANDRTCAQTAIDAVIQRVGGFTKTVRYDPVGDRADWEIGSPYIPYSHTHDQSDQLRLIVEWE